jgi:hypothetical protein
MKWVQFQDEYRCMPSNSTEALMVPHGLGNAMRRALQRIISADRNDPGFIAFLRERASTEAIDA